MSVTKCLRSRSYQPYVRFFKFYNNRPIRFRLLLAEAGVHVAFFGYSSFCATSHPDFTTQALIFCIYVEKQQKTSVYS